jgi:hypothetical protein
MKIRLLYSTITEDTDTSMREMGNLAAELMQRQTKSQASIRLHSQLGDDKLSDEPGAFWVVATLPKQHGVSKHLSQLAAKHGYVVHPITDQSQVDKRSQDQGLNFDRIQSQFKPPKEDETIVAYWIDVASGKPVDPPEYIYHIGEVDPDVVKKEGLHPQSTTKYKDRIYFWTDRRAARDFLIRSVYAYSIATDGLENQFFRDAEVSNLNAKYAIYTNTPIPPDHVQLVAKNPHPFTGNYN